MNKKELLSLEKRAIRLQREVLKIVDKIYEENDFFGDVVNEELKDEIFLRNKKND